MTHFSWAILLTFLSCTGCVDQLSDDALEPNDTIEDATEITAGIPIDARANQGNSDVFKFEVDAEEILSIDVVSRGKDNCPGFSLIDSNELVLFKDARARCLRIGQPDIHDPTVEFQINDEDYFFQTKTTTSGYYYFTITEGRDADNIFPYSWDYRLTVTLE